MLGHLGWQENNIFTAFFFFSVRATLPYQKLHFQSRTGKFSHLDALESMLLALAIRKKNLRSRHRDIRFKRLIHWPF